MTHRFVLAESVALATARRFSRPAILAYVADLLTLPLIDIVWVDEALTTDHHFTLASFRPLLTA